jgi:hypothetical protein
MKKNKLQGIIKNQVIDSLSEKYILVGNFIVNVQVTELIAGFCFENSSSESSMYIWWFVQPLYVPSNIIHLTFGGRIKMPSQSQIWNFENKHFEETIVILKKELQLAEKSITHLGSPERFYEHYKKKQQT